jgi:predicted SAM-dependent methyltransferase
MMFSLLKNTRNKIIRFLRRKYFEKRIKKGPIKLVIGAAGIAQKDWIPSEMHFLNLLNEKDWDKYFTADSIDAIMAEHVWEHLTKDEAIVAAKNCYKYLRTGGYLRLAVPDGYHPSKEYIERVKPGGTGAGSDDHKLLYNYKTFKEVFESVGFKVKLLEYFNENREFVYNEWSPEDGLIRRSSRFDERNIEKKLSYTSIIINAVK